MLDIFDELQHRLKFEEHDNAISVLFRVLLELSIELYISEFSVPDVHNGEKLANKYRKVIKHMEAAGRLDAKQQAALKKFSNNDVLFSANTLHSYVHSSDFFPSDHHLKSMWDSLEGFIVACLSSQTDGR